MKKLLFISIISIALSFLLLYCNKDFSPVSGEEYLLLECTACTTSELISGDSTQFPPPPNFMPPRGKISFDPDNMTLIVKDLSVDWKNNLKIILLQHFSSNTFLDYSSFSMLNLFYDTDNSNVSGVIEKLSLSSDNLVEIKFKFEDYVRNLKVNEKEKALNSYLTQIIQLNGDTAVVRINSIISVENFGYIQKSQIIQE